MVQRRVDIPRAERVDVDAEAPPFQRHRPGHVHHRRLAHRVDADLAEGAQPGHRGNVDDASAGEGAWRRAARAGDHAFANLLSDEKRAPGVGVEDMVEIRRHHVDQLLAGADAGVVDQDVDGAHFGLGVGHRRFDAVVVVDVQTHDMGVAAFGLQLGAQRLQLLYPTRRQYHAGPCARQRAGELCAQAAGGAGDKGHAAGEIDLVGHGGQCEAFEKWHSP